MLDIFIPKLVLHSRPSLYRILTSGCSHRFHIGPVLDNLDSRFITANLTFLALEREYHVK